MSGGVVFTNFHQMPCADFNDCADPVATAPGSDTAAKPCSISAIMSDTLSMPTELRINPSEIPNCRRRAGDKSRCDEVDGFITLVNTSPRLVDRTQSLRLFMNRKAASRELSSSSIETKAPAC